MSTQYNHALSLLALAVKASMAGKPQAAAKALVEAGSHPSFADVIATVNHQLKVQAKAKVAAKASKSSVSRLARAIAEAGDMQDADKPGEDLRLEVDDVVTTASDDEDDDGDDDSEGSDDDDDKEEDKEVARFARALANMNKGK